MACSFSASVDPSRLAGRLSSQARYSSCRSISVATAAAQRVGRGAGYAASAACDPRGGAGHGAAPGVRRGSSAQRRCDVWACSHASGNRDCHVCQLAQVVGQAWHQEPVSLFDRSTVSSSRPRFREAARAAAVKTGPTKGRAIAAGGLVLTAASTGPDWVQVGGCDHAACRNASLLCSARCCMFK